MLRALLLLMLLLLCTRAAPSAFLFHLVSAQRHAHTLPLASSPRRSSAGARWHALHASRQPLDLPLPLPMLPPLLLQPLHASSPLPTCSTLSQRHIMLTHFLSHPSLAVAALESADTRAALVPATAHAPTLPLLPQLLSLPVRASLHACAHTAALPAACSCAAALSRASIPLGRALVACSHAPPASLPLFSPHARPLFSH